MKILGQLLLLLCSFMTIGEASKAQPYPNQFVRLVVPYPPGGAVDVTGRLVAEYLQKELKQTVIVENKAGAGGTLGANFVAKAAPDGYTILLSGAATHAFAPSLYKSLQYDPVADFIPITQVSEGPLGLAVSVESGIRDLASFIAAMKTSGPSSNYASNGFGTYPHLAMERFKQAAGFDIKHVPFRGGNEAVTALLGAHVQATLNHVPIIVSQAEAGKIRILATTGTARSPVLASIPTLKESGYDVVASAWFGLFAPAKTPRDIVDRISEAVARVAQNPEFKAKLLAQGDEIRVEGPDKFLTFQKNEIEYWTQVIKTAGIVPN